MSKNPRLGTHALLLIISLVFCDGVRADDWRSRNSQHASHPDVEFLYFNTNLDSKPLMQLIETSHIKVWGVNQHRIAASKQTIDSLNQSEIYALHYLRQSYTASFVESYEHTLFQQILDDHSAVALLEINDNKLLELLSHSHHRNRSDPIQFYATEMLHNATDPNIGQMPCGQIQKLQWTNLIAQPEKTLDPIYREYIALDSVTNLINAVNADAMTTHIETLVALESRFHESESGVETPTVIQEMAESIISQGARTDINIELFDHGSLTPQNSILIKIPGDDPGAPRFIVGAHLDSIHYGDNSDAPGADDNASGIATLLEILAAISSTGSTFTRPIELHGYAAEEIGLVGSAHIAAEYRSAGTEIAGMIQVDMNGYSEIVGDQTIYLITTDTNGNMIRSARDIISTYLDGTFEMASLSVGTSDHKSFYNQGYPTLFPFENPSAYNTRLHTAEDTVANLNNIGLSARFSQFVLAFLAHNAGLLEAASDYSEAVESGANALANDLHVAISASDDAADTFSISVASEEVFKYIAICSVTSFSEQTCLASGVDSRLDPVGSRDGRVFYSTDETFSFSDGQYVSLKGYDKNLNLKGKRIIKLDAK